MFDTSSVRGTPPGIVHRITRATLEKRTEERKAAVGKGKQNKTTVGGVLRRGRLTDFGGKDRSESRSIEKVKSRNFACESPTIT